MSDDSSSSPSDHTSPINISFDVCSGCHTNRFSAPDKIQDILLAEADHNNNNEQQSSSSPNSSNSSNGALPLIGSCGHSICRDCVVKYHQQIVDETKQRHRVNVPCPCCKQEGSFKTTTLSVNLALCQILRAIRKKQKRKHNNNSNAATDLPPVIMVDTCPGCKNRQFSVETKNDNSPVIGLCGHTFCRMCTWDYRAIAKAEKSMKENSLLVYIPCPNGDKCHWNWPNNNNKKGTPKPFHTNKPIWNYAFIEALTIWRNMDRYIQAFAEEEQEMAEMEAMTRAAQQRQQQRLDLKQEGQCQPQLEATEAATEGATTSNDNDYLAGENEDADTAIKQEDDGPIKEEEQEQESEPESNNIPSPTKDVRTAPAHHKVDVKQEENEQVKQQDEQNHEQQELSNSQHSTSSLTYESFPHQGELSDEENMEAYLDDDSELSSSSDDDSDDVSEWRPTDQIQRQSIADDIIAEVDALPRISKQHADDTRLKPSAQETTVQGESVAKSGMTAGNSDDDLSLRPPRKKRRTEQSNNKDLNATVAAATKDASEQRRRSVTEAEAEKRDGDASLEDRAQNVTRESKDTTNAKMQEGDNNLPNDDSDEEIELVGVQASLKETEASKAVFPPPPARPVRSPEVIELPDDDDDDASDDDIEVVEVQEAPLPPGVDSLKCIRQPEERLMEIIYAAKAVTYVCINEHEENPRIWEWKITFIHNNQRHFCVLDDATVREYMDVHDYHAMVDGSTTKAFLILTYHQGSKEWSVATQHGSKQTLDDEYVRRTFRPEFLDQVRAESGAKPRRTRNIQPWCLLLPPVNSASARKFFSDDILEFKQHDPIKECKVAIAFASAIYNMGMADEAERIYQEGKSRKNDSTENQMKMLTALVKKHLKDYQLQVDPTQVSSRFGGSKISIRDASPIVVRPKLASKHRTCLLVLYDGKVYEPTLSHPLRWLNSKTALDICCGGSGEFIGIDECWRLVKVKK